MAGRRVAGQQIERLLRYGFWHIRPVVHSLIQLTCLKKPLLSTQTLAIPTTFVSPCSYPWISQMTVQEFNGWAIFQTVSLACQCDGFG